MSWWAIRRSENRVRSGLNWVWCQRRLAHCAEDVLVVGESIEAIGVWGGDVDMARGGPGTITMGGYAVSFGVSRVFHAFGPFQGVTDAVSMGTAGWEAVGTRARYGRQKEA